MAGEGGKTCSREYPRAVRHHGILGPIHRSTLRRIEYTAAASGSWTDSIAKDWYYRAQREGCQGARGPRCQGGSRMNRFLVLAASLVVAASTALGAGTDFPLQHWVATWTASPVPPGTTFAAPPEAFEN